jgi:hypothetical protein
MSHALEVQREIDRYLDEVTLALSAQHARDSDKVVSELRSHIDEKLRSRAMSSGELTHALVELGSPRDIADESRVTVQEKGRRSVFVMATCRFAKSPTAGLNDRVRQRSDPK